MNPNVNVLIIVATFLAVAAGVLFVIFSGYGLADLLKPTEEKLIRYESDPKLKGLQATFEEEASPLWPQHLIDLFIRPSRFFSGQIALRKTPYVIFVTWCYGVASVISMIDRDLVGESRGRAPVWKLTGLMVADSWFDFWLWVIGLGAVGGLFLWLMGGWWYDVRLRWSGAKNLNDRSSRLLYVYTSFVDSAPTIVIVLLWTAIMPSYRQGLTAGRNYFGALLLFPFWSLVTSYIGATTLFALSRRKARIWFLGLPALFYVFTLGLAPILTVIFRSHG